jgi:hypothetical protein
MAKNPPIAGRKPDYKVMAWRKSDGGKGEIGAGWKNPDGSITLYFNPFAQVPSGPGFSITAWPVETLPRNRFEAIDQEHPPTDTGEPPF